MLGTFKHYYMDTSKQPCRAVLFSPSYWQTCVSGAVYMASSRLSRDKSASLLSGCLLILITQHPSPLLISISLSFEGIASLPLWVVPEVALARFFLWEDLEEKDFQGLSLVNWIFSLQFWGEEEETASARSPCLNSWPTFKPASPDPHQFDTLGSPISS